MSETNPIADLERWTVGVPSLDLAIAVAHSLLMHRDLAVASRWINKLIALDPSRAGPLFDQLRASGRQIELESRITLARQALLANDTAQARRILEQVLQQNPESAAALIERARVSMREDSVVVARALIQRALRLQPTDDDRYEAYSNLGILAMRDGNTEDGLSQFERATTVRPDEADAWLYRARALAQMGRADEARLVLDQGRKVASEPATLNAAYQQLNATGSLP